nr:Chain C, Syntaxin-4 N-terminal peptide [Mus musculus]3PUJ_D Chain D, Syntaxin-4 N-terminal peptide [Mus musculus]3PUK_C Chain C, Syntaxin-4 N-terminal peptide [Mus musculus]3PUK_D Chain D, Syntaxin-4 N-terminal peptide [Mus musculus]
MRDRTHELRQ